MPADALGSFFDPNWRPFSSLPSSFVGRSSGYVSRETAFLRPHLRYSQRLGLRARRHWDHHREGCPVLFHVKHGHVTSGKLIVPEDPEPAKIAQRGICHSSKMTPVSSQQHNSPTEWAKSLGFRSTLPDERPTLVCRVGQLLSNLMHYLSAKVCVRAVVLSRINVGKSLLDMTPASGLHRMCCSSCVYSILK